ncbi:uncharacterized protein LOC106175148 isoform X1 [Lingula anatina]|uniref:Uncharacterized protein LOC106175148 isoform X1 n=1 Tax=Lingula anatina TaxID=7574 RepID=A0A1S3JR37_LINAN|nr:uncharacterized protein LOC106175148 isoform X1 [Lingula anatina]XP_013412449.1 uncharacterized protein LOC106175148 isoform X1 [Lingula anatina]XP_013412451.1 uncharacterized protein LOC106175148 isoform X1 [Lingula anatina]|eukprot:XP_013412448.1 uncharacterized protein LOC106175148 isoform X1 [Lingula anatina]
MPEICLPASFSGHTVMSTDERNEANHEYNFFLDRKIQEQLFDADENLDKTAQTNTQIKTPRKGNTSKNSVQSQTEICEWIPRTGFALRRPEKEINNNNNGTSKKKEDSSHGAPANWRDPHGRQKEIDFKFRHYYDIRKYIEQYRKHHTCQVPVRGLSGKLYRQYLQQAQTQTFEQNFAIGAGYQEPKSCTPPELIHVNQSSNQDGYKYKTTSRAIKYDHDYDKGQSSFGERSSKGQNYNVTLTPTKVGVRDGVPYPMSASPKVLRQPPGMPVVNIVQPRDSSHAVPMTPQHTIDLLAKMTVASDKQVDDSDSVSTSLSKLSTTCLNAEKIRKSDSAPATYRAPSQSEDSGMGSQSATVVAPLTNTISTTTASSADSNKLWTMSQNVDPNSAHKFPHSHSAPSLGSKFSEYNRVSTTPFKVKKNIPKTKSENFQLHRANTEDILGLKCMKEDSSTNFHSWANFDTRNPTVPLFRHLTRANNVSSKTKAYRSKKKELGFGACNTSSTAKDAATIQKLADLLVMSEPPSLPMPQTSSQSASYSKTDAPANQMGSKQHSVPSIVHGVYCHFFLPFHRVSFSNTHLSYVTYHFYLLISVDFVCFLHTFYILSS